MRPGKWQRGRPTGLLNGTWKNSPLCSESSLSLHMTPPLRFVRDRLLGDFSCLKTVRGWYPEARWEPLSWNRCFQALGCPQSLPRHRTMIPTVSLGQCPAAPGGGVLAEFYFLFKLLFPHGKRVAHVSPSLSVNSILGRDWGKKLAGHRRLTGLHWPVHLEAILHLTDDLDFYFGEGTTVCILLHSCIFALTHL